MTSILRQFAGVSFFLLLSVLTTSCQSPSTRGSSTETAVVDPKAEAARVLALQPVILDTRSPLDYGVSHVPGAINVLWSDFGRPGSRDPGVLDPDHFGLARRLALWGVTPEKPVLVIGFNSAREQGEAGRVAWMLRFLGVNQVIVGSDAIYRGSIPRGAERPRNEPSWIPSIRQELEISLPDFLARASAPQRSGIITKARRSALGGMIVPEKPTVNRVIVDVRDENEVEAIPTEHLKIKLVRIPWRQFYLPDGRINPEGKKFLTDQNVGEASELLIVSEDGAKGAAATFALESLGWTKLGFVSAGWPGVRRSLAPAGAGR